MRFVTLLAFFCLCGVTAWAQGGLKVGDRVMVESVHEPGIVVEVSPRGNMVSVILDKFHTKDPSMAIMYDVKGSRVHVLAGAAPGGAEGTNQTGPVATADTGGGLQPASASDNDRREVPNSAPPTKETFMRLIRRQYATSYPYSRVDTTFQTFDVAGPMQVRDYLSTDNTAPSGRVHTVYKVHSHLTVYVHRTTHGDTSQLRTIDGRWQIFKSPTGEWLAGPDSGDNQGTTQRLNKD